jgi:hypothetical protein
MINWIRSWFGKGKLVYDITTNKSCYRVRISYVGCLSALDHKEMIKRINFDLSYGEYITKWEYVGAC